MTLYITSWMVVKDLLCFWLDAKILANLCKNPQVTYLSSLRASELELPEFGPGCLSIIR